MNIHQKERILFFHSCDYNTFSFYVLRMWWESNTFSFCILRMWWESLSVCLSIWLYACTWTLLMHNIRLFCGTQCSALHRGGKPRTKISYHRWRRYRSCGERVTDSSQARLRLNRHIPCVQYKRATLRILNQCRVHMPQTFSLVPVFRLVFVERC